MATAIDNVLRPVVRDVIARFGTNLTIKQTGATAGSGMTVAHTAVPQTVKGSPPSRMKLSANNPNIERGDMQTVVSPLASGWAFVPAPTDVLDFSGKSYRIIDVFPLNSGDQVAAYKLQLRA